MHDLSDTVGPALQIPITEERPWAAFAVCRDSDPDGFFPVTPEGERAAIRVCQGCPVQQDCLGFAIEARIRFGVWGGMTEKQRRSFQRQSA